MLPIYKAVPPVKRIDRGGSTYPWIVHVQTEIGLQPYVVKLFTKKHIQQYNPVVKEVLANVLASEFDLSVPQPALIQFDDNFIRTLDPKMKEELKGKDERIKFGCRYIKGATTYSPTLNRKFFKKYDIETIFAFDNLIQNADRRQDKPNMLLLEKEAYLIDHELSLLGTNEKVTEDFLGGNWYYNKERHIFYKILKKGRKNSKICYFESFSEYLKYLDIYKLNEYIYTLKDYKHNVEEYKTIKYYLEVIKKDHSKFVSLLRNSVL